MDLADLHRLREASRSCTACDLSETRTQVVWGSGAESARILVIGEAPGRNEDRGGEPFIGAAGRLLDEALAGAGIAREDLFITNIVKCRPPKNRNPAPTEVAACERWTRAQIDAINPAVIVTLGNVASRWILGTAEPISALRGRVFELDGRVVVPTYHPAAAIYDPAKREPLYDDVCSVKGLVL